MRGDAAICGNLFSYIDLESGSGPITSPAAGDSRDCQCRAPIVVRRVSKALFAARPRVDPAGAAATRVAVASVLFDPRSGSWSSGLIMICCSDGLSGSASRTRCGRHHLQQESRPAAERDVASPFLAAMLSQDEVKALLSSEHFSVDGTLLEAWASLKSFRPKDGSGEPADPGRNGERNFHGERRRNNSRGSTTDPEARLFR
jgi:hypothetical protein